jgi:dienelactone hydrolase
VKRGIRRRRWLSVVAAAILALVGGLALNTWRGAMGWALTERSPDELAAELRPAYSVTRPPGDGPFATALLFSGCDGPKDNLERMARALRRAGWASVVVDSHGPRGYDHAQLWRLICAAQLLTGTERAADVAVALDDVRAMAFVDADRLALIGASHGGWAILDFLALQATGEPPPTLTAWPASLEARGLQGVGAAVLFYPYCGPISRMRQVAWRAPLALRFVLVADDAIVDETDCVTVAAELRRRDMQVEVDMLRGVTHGFDQREKSALSTLAFAPAAAAATRRKTVDFLARHAAR